MGHDSLVKYVDRWQHVDAYCMLTCTLRTLTETFLTYLLTYLQKRGSLYNDNVSVKQV